MLAGSLGLVLCFGVFICYFLEDIPSPADATCCGLVSDFVSIHGFDVDRFREFGKSLVRLFLFGIGFS
jgi:hypothetical protein